MAKFLGQAQFNRFLYRNRNLFAYDWNSVDKKITILDPLYNKIHQCDVYYIDVGERIFFAHIEITNGVDLFYEISKNDEKKLTKKLNKNYGVFRK